MITPLGSTDICQSGFVDLQANFAANFTYEWKRFGVSIPGATSQTYHATQTGNYKVITTNANGCSKTSDVTTVYTSCKLNDQVFINSIEVYPNPAASAATVSFQLPETASTNIQLKDVQGRTVQTIFTGTLTEGMHQYSIPCEKLSAGIYFINVMVNEKNNVLKLVVE